MRTEGHITQLFCMVDDNPGSVKKLKNANLYAGEIINKLLVS